MIRVAIIGCGRIGAKRAAALTESVLVVTCDREMSRAAELAAQHAGCRVEADPLAAASAADVDLVIVATTHDQLAPIATEAVRTRKHVLVEKPGARSAAELARLAEEIERRGVVAKVGFNHRFHPAVRRAIELAPELGPTLFVRGRYGHGGRLGYETEWRLDPRISGGGELIDQGVHLVDLARVFLGDFSSVQGHLARYFWNAPVEDNAFLSLTTAAGQVAWLHASWTEWKNLFCLEVACQGGKLQIDGLGGSYGVERLTLYKMGPRLGPPETSVWDYPGEDTSWTEEYRHMLDCIRHGHLPSGNIHDACAALSIVERIYAASSFQP